MKKEEKEKKGSKNDTKTKINIWNKFSIFIAIVALGFSGFSSVTSYNALNEANMIHSEAINIEKELYRIENETFNAIEPFQKPIINLESADIKADITQYLNAIKIKFDIVFQFKNYGKGIAQNTKYTIYMGNLEYPELLREVTNDTSVNDIYPDSGRATRWSISFEYTDNTLILDESELSFIIRTEYIDKASGSSENQTFWSKYTVGDDNLDDLSLKEKTKLLPYYNGLINQELKSEK